MTRKKIYVAGEGMITALGRGVENNVSAIRSGKSGVCRHSGLLKDESGNDVPVMCGLVPEEVVSRLREEYSGVSVTLTRLELLAAGALADALADADSRRESGGNGVSACRRALVFASTKGNIGILGSCPSGSLPEDVYLDVTARKIGMLYGCSPEDVYTVSIACISGVSAMVVAKRFIE